MASPDKGTGFCAYLRCKKDNIVARSRPRSALDLSTSIPSLHPNTQSLHAKPATSQSSSTADDVVASNSPLQHSDKDQLPVTIDPLKGTNTARDTATVRVSQLITPMPSAIQALTITLRKLHSATEVFPPLQVAVGGLLASIEHIEVGNLGRIRRLHGLGKTAVIPHQAAPPAYTRNQVDQSFRVPSRNCNVSYARRVESGNLTECIGLSKSKRRPSAASRTTKPQDTLGMWNRTRKGYYAKIEASLKTWNIAKEQLAHSRLACLSPVESAIYNSLLSHDVNRRACTQNTWSDILLELDQWSLDQNKPSVYWMNGMAGTGKTTIAYTFSRCLENRGALGASFFCTRTSEECQNVGRIIPTIAYQLAQCSPAFRSALLEVLEQQPNIKSQSIDRQCERLIKEPLSRLKNKMTKGLVVVIDALDECSNANGVRTILEVLFRITPTLPLRFFVTSRPEPDIRHRIKAQSDRNRTMCVLHEIEKSLVESTGRHPHTLSAQSTQPQNHIHWVFATRRQARHAAFSPDGTRVASCSSGTVKMWNTLYSASSQTSQSSAPIKAIYSVAISPDGSRIAVAGGDKAIYMFNTHDGTAALQPLVAHTGEISSVAFSLNGRYLASGGDDNGICLWDATSGKLLSGPVAGHENCIWSVSFSPDSRCIVSASSDKTIRTWDVDDETLAPTDLVGTHDDKVNSAVFSPDGRHIVSGCDDKKIWMWNSQMLSLVFDPFGWQQHEGPIRSVTFSPDGRLIASGSGDGTICIFGSHSGELVLGPLKGHQHSVKSVVFSPDGDYIVSGSEDQSVRVWRVGDGAPACEALEGHQNQVQSVACSPNGAYIVSGSSGSTIRVWKAPGRGVGSDLSLSAFSTSDERQPHYAIAGGLTINSDGWARNHNSQPPIRSGLKARFERIIVSDCCLGTSGIDVLLAESEVNIVDAVDQ
ncbi:WD40 domain-containing protein [Rhizoctonia solani AG-1 IA]|uniref:WD40 domain-containing protein n=1 Tax=Thanatephorus cucumeris (strain AG1-IA) TaxID=983506 RepID=L8WIU7_THACA|nr:WD40 domain-containing protein [Rhizoctonia solani AG-1 IA]